MALVAAMIWAVLTQGPTAPLVGRVVGPGGEPLAGAEVLLAGLPGPGEIPVLATGRSDARGDFKLDRPADLVGENRYQPPALWVVRPGLRVGVVRLVGPLPGADEPVRVALGPPAKAEVLVNGPDGAPRAGVHVRVRRLHRNFLDVPEAIAERTEGTTDADGRAVLDAFAPEEVAVVEARAEGFGIQPRLFEAPTAGPKRIDLRPAAPLEGRFVAEDGRPLRGWRVEASTRPDDMPGFHGIHAGWAEAVVAEDGSFRIAEIAVGALDLYVRWPGESEVLPAWPDRMAVRAGRDNRLEIPVRSAATVAGTVRERGTGAPVPGVRLWLFRAGESRGESMGTDAEGRYHERSLPGKARIDLMEAPPTHVFLPSTLREEIVVPEPPGRVVLPPVELLKAAPPLRGKVVDEAGRPVPGAVVKAPWYFSENQVGLSRTSEAITDALGRFALASIPPDLPLAISARRRERATAEPVRARAGQAEPVVVAIRPTATVALAGRVLGPGGTPLAVAAVRFVAQTRRKDGFIDNYREVDIDGSRWTFTGADGAYRTPKELDRAGTEYRAEVQADGFLPGQSPWVAAGDGDVVRLPDVVLRRDPGLRVVSGRVVDRDGAPVAGARVLQRGDGPRPTEAVADADGRFRLPGVSGGPALVFAEAPGFRFGGAIVGPSGTAEVRLARADGPPASGPARAPEPLSRAEERGLARRLLGPVLAQSRSGRTGSTTGDPALTLARVDPERTLAMLEDRVLPDPSAALARVALGQFEDDPAAAVATIEASQDPGAQARGLLALADFAEDFAPGRRGDLLDRAAASARRVADRKAKLYLLGEVADRRLESFDLEQATTILREGRELLDRPSGDMFPFDVAPFGEAMAALDPETALTFLAKRAPGGSDDVSTRARDRGAVAVRAAYRDPAEAERLARTLKVVPNFYEPEIYVLRIARNLVRADLARARAVLDLLDDLGSDRKLGRTALKPYGLAMLAEARAGIDPEGARALLDEAFAGLRRVADEQPGQPTYPPVSGVMAELLPTVERLQPDRVAERLWLAAACRPSRPEPLEPAAVPTLATLAMLASRYDRALAAAIFEPVAVRLPELAVEPQGGAFFGYSASNPLRVIAAYDPRAIVALIDRLPDVARKAEPPRNGWESPSLETMIRLAAAEALGMPPEVRRRAVLRGPFGKWPVHGNGRSLRFN